MPLINYICLTCKKSFTHHKKNKKYCSHKCYASRYDIVTKECIICCADFTVAYRFRDKLTCSLECNKQRISMQSKKYIKTCLGCGIKFEVSRNMVKYHSRECFFSMQEKRRQQTIKLICEGCGVEFEVLYRKRKQRFHSKSCANSGEHNGMFGKPGTMTGKIAWNNGLTAETDERIKRLGEKVSISLKEGFASGRRSNAGENNPMYGKTKETMSHEQLENYSKAAVKRIQEGKTKPFKQCEQGYYTSTKMNTRYFYRSSWEKIVMKWCDANPDVQSFEYEQLVIPYNNNLQRYIIDFNINFMSGKCLLIEVKPYEFLQFEDIQKKIAVGQQYAHENGCEYEVWSRKEIENCQIELLKWVDDNTMLNL